MVRIHVVIFLVISSYEDYINKTSGLLYAAPKAPNTSSYMVLEQLTFGDAIGDVDRC
jgi:hypothetical protein